MPLLRGRDFSAADRLNPSHVTVINDALARALFGDEDPVGRRITNGGGNANDDWHIVIGVVGDVRHHSLDAPPGPRMYDLLGEHWGRTMYIVAKARMPESATLIPALRSAIVELDREAPVFEASTMNTLVERSAAPYRLVAGCRALAFVSTCWRWSALRGDGRVGRRATRKSVSSRAQAAPRTCCGLS
jgi:hypothetical protein